MNDDIGMKSSIELAMERLRKKDADAGIERQPVTDAQRTAIAEIKNFYAAKLAELELLHQSQARGLFDPDAQAALQEDYRRDRERLISDREAKIEKARLTSA